MGASMHLYAVQKAHPMTTKNHIEAPREGFRNLYDKNWLLAILFVSSLFAAQTHKTKIVENTDRADKTNERRFDLLKLEITTINAKIDVTLRSLWGIRVFSLTLWTAAISVGLGQFLPSNIGGIRSVPLIISAVLPCVFLIVDGRYQAWYRRLVVREGEISLFVNDLHKDKKGDKSRGYILP